MWTLEARLAEAELAEKSFRTTMGKNGKAARGLYPSGRAPYGYRWTGGDSSQLEVEPERAAIVLLIFERVAEARCLTAFIASLHSIFWCGTLTAPANMA